MPGRVAFRPLPAVARLALLLAALAPALAGCAFTPPEQPPIEEPIPLNDSPQNTLRRFEFVYERKVLVDYEALFTSDFRFTFSSQSDPELAELYGTSWGKDDEIESTSHLFDGFTDHEGREHGAAALIELALEGASIVDDPGRPDSAAWYRWAIVPSVQLRLSIVGGEEITIAAPHDLYLVRGDAAVLDEAQEARADRWYVRRWDDRSAALPGAGTWGAVRAHYGPSSTPER